MFKKIIKISLVASLSLSTLNAAQEEVKTEDRDRIPSVQKAIQTVGNIPEKEVSVVDNFRHMFEDGKVTGQIRTMYSEYYNENADNTYATALGGQLKYELAEFNGFNAGVAFSTTHNLDMITGKDTYFNDNLSSSSSHYTEMSEAYLNYAYQDFNFRAGRQVLDTPLADSDDCRMIPNTFEAYIASLALGDFTLIGGAVYKWQGGDAGLNTPWGKTGENGTYVGAVTYATDILEANLWYYNVTETANAVYLDVYGNFDFNDNMALHFGVQYLDESEIDNSGVDASIYGVMAEFVAFDIGINAAYNKATSKNGTQSFSGFGGGTLFTSMDNMILDNMTVNNDSQAYVLGLSYSIADFNLLYAYGDFSADKDTLEVKKHVVEQDFGVEYTPNDNVVLAAIYTIDDNKEDATAAGFLSDTNGHNFRLFASYNF